MVSPDPPVPEEGQPDVGLWGVGTYERRIYLVPPVITDKLLRPGVYGSGARMSEEQLTDYERRVRRNSYLVGMLFSPLLVVFVLLWILWRTEIKPSVCPNRE
jgi:hypothetical protein